MINNVRNNNKKAAILEEAGKLFQRKGYADTSMEDIGNSVGLLKGSLYRYFNSKEDILYEIVIAPGKAAVEALEQVVDSNLTPVEKLREAVLLQMKLFNDYYPNIFVALNEGFASVSDQMREKFFKYRIRYKQLWNDIIAAGVKSGEFRSDIDPKVACYAILGMCNWMCKWYEKDGRLSFETIGDQYFHLITQGLASASPDANSTATASLIDSASGCGANRRIELVA